MIRATVRALLLAGAAATLALAARDPLAARVVPTLDAPVRALAGVARELSPRARPAPPTAPARTTPPVMERSEPALAQAPRARALTPTPAHASLTPTRPSPVRVTRQQVAAAIESRAGGASAVVVHDDAGAPSGLRLAGVSRLAPLGVREGDVLISANGLPLRTAEEALAALGALQAAERIVVMVRRGPQTVALPIDLVGDPAE